MPVLTIIIFANCIAGNEAWVWLYVCDYWIEMMKLIKIWRWQFSKEKERAWWRNLVALTTTFWVLKFEKNGEWV